MLITLGFLLIDNQLVCEYGGKWPVKRSFIEINQTDKFIKEECTRSVDSFGIIILY